MTNWTALLWPGIVTRNVSEEVTYGDSLTYAFCFCAFRECKRQRLSSVAPKEPNNKAQGNAVVVLHKSKTGVFMKECDVVTAYLPKVYNGKWTKKHMRHTSLPYRGLHTCVIQRGRCPFLSISRGVFLGMPGPLLRTVSARLRPMPLPPLLSVSFQLAADASSGQTPIG